MDGRPLLHLHDLRPPNQHRLRHHFPLPGPRLPPPVCRLLAARQREHGHGHPTRDRGRRLCIRDVVRGLVDLRRLAPGIGRLPLQSACR